MIRNASVWSATASAFFPGVLTSGSPRSLTAVDVDVDRAAACAADQLQVGRGVENGVGHRRTLHDQHLDPRHPLAQLRGRALGLLQPPLRLRLRRERTLRVDLCVPDLVLGLQPREALLEVPRRHEGVPDGKNPHLSSSVLSERPARHSSSPLDSRGGVTITSSCPDNKSGTTAI